MMEKNYYNNKQIYDYERILKEIPEDKYGLYTVRLNTQLDKNYPLKHLMNDIALLKNGKFPENLCLMKLTEDFIKLDPIIILQKAEPVNLPGINDVKNLIPCDIGIYKLTFEATMIKEQSYKALKFCEEFLKEHPEYKLKGAE